MMPLYWIISLSFNKYRLQNHLRKYFSAVNTLHNVALKIDLIIEYNDSLVQDFGNNIANAL